MNHYFDWMNEMKVPFLKPHQLIYIALRDVDAHERHIIKELGIKAYTMHDIDKHGIGKIMEMVLDHAIGRKEKPLHLSFDIDSIDPLYAPSTGTRVAGGLTYREAYFICESLAHSKLLASMDVVEVNPSLYGMGIASQIGSMGTGNIVPVKDGTAEMAVGLMSSALGNSII